MVVALVSLMLVLVGTAVALWAAFRGARESRAAGSFEADTYPGDFDRYNADREWRRTRPFSSLTLIVIGICISAVGGVVSLLPSLFD